MSAHEGKVWLVGAGPGDPGLITLAGLQAIRRADVIVYDRLVSPRLLEHARPDAELVYMGKIGHEAGHDQSAINETLVAKARQGRRVVRLKGGDPFVFGRGGEEAEALHDAGVPFEVVPGVTSAVAVPAYAGIPVTHRGVASSFAVITGHEAENVILSGDEGLARQATGSRRPVLSEVEGNLGGGSARTKQGGAPEAIDWARLATAVDTLVLLMGVKTLPDAVERLIAGGRPPQTPVAVIRWGTTPDQRTVTGTLSDIVRRVGEADLRPPAITVVGEVVRLRETLRWFESRPLFGKRVLITRTRRQASALARLLAEEGAVPIELPAIEIEPAYDAAAVAAALDRLSEGAYAWAVFTSANAVELWFDLMRERGLDARSFGGVRVAAIGPATAEALAERGITADAVPDEYVAESLTATLRDPSSVIPSGDSGLARNEGPPRGNLGRGSGRPSPQSLQSGDRVLVPRAEGARPELVEGLCDLGAQVDEVALYRAAVPASAPAEALSLLRDGGIDIVTFTSSSTVRNLASLLGDDFPAVLGRDPSVIPSGDSGLAREATGSRGNLGWGSGRTETPGARARPLIACIGPITAATARELGLPVDVEAPEHTVAGLVRAVREKYEG